MFKHLKMVLFFPIFIIALTFSFAFASPVIADDGQPVDPPQTEITQPPQEGGGQGEPVDSVDQPETPADPVVTTDPPANPEVVDAGLEETVVDNNAPESIIQDSVAALSENGITLVEPSGEPVAMASRSSGDLVVDGDPYFTVGSITYRFMKPGACGILTNCYESTTPIQDALDFMAANNLTPTDKKLYVEPDTYDEDVMINGSLNGVKGLLGLIGKGATPEDVLIQGSLYITNMASGFTVSNLSVFNPYYDDDAAIWAWNNKGTLKLVDVNATATGTDSSGIIIDHTGTVELDRVEASGSGYLGARIYNSGAVKITNSSFDHNLNDVDDGIFYDDYYDEFGVYEGSYPSYAGLEVNVGTNSPITLNGVSAVGNIGDGVDINARKSTITIKNSVFDNNDDLDLVGGWGDGLWVDGNIINLENIQASGNNMRGIFAAIDASFTGLHLHVESNGGTGIDISGCTDYSDSDSYCDNIGAATVTIKTSSSSGNGGEGINIYTKGAVTVSDVYLGSNGGDGIYVDNSQAQSPAAITLTRLDVDGNATGIDLFTRGVVTINGLTSRNNAFDGLYIKNSGIAAITITNAAGVFNEINTNGGYGYYIESNGAVTITNLDSWDNGLLGGYIDNSTAPTAASVTINTSAPANYVNWYGSNGMGGLYINSRGTVTISRLNAIGNYGYGVVIYNIPPGTAAGSPVSISDSSFDNNVIWDGNSDENGLFVESKGLITLTNVSAFYNDGIGVQLNNQVPGATSGVTINAGANKGNAFVGNTFEGLAIYTNGAVTITNIYANDNGYDGGYGALILNPTGTSGVTIKQTGSWSGQDYWAEGNTFSNNSFGGLFIGSNGAVTVDFFQARDNGGFGIEVFSAGGTGAVTIKGTNNLDRNLSYNGRGMRVTSRGNITLTNVDVSENGDYGASLVNDTGTGTVTLTNAYFNYNYTGLEVLTTGIVTWKNGSASDNFLYGAFIDNQGIALTGKPVTITNVYAGSNGLTGLSIYSKGIVTLTDTEANNNSANYFIVAYGERWLDNLNDDQVWVFDGTTGDNVTVQVNTPNFNPWIYITDPDGNYVDSANGIDGSLTLTIDLPVDGDYMIHVGTEEGWNGYGYELSLYEGSVPFLWNVKESDANGIYIDNHNGVNTGVTITNNGYYRWNSNNSGTNVVILSSGAVALTRMDLNDSVQGGLYINNSFSTLTPGVTLTNVNLNLNDQTAAEIYTKGAVIVKTADVSGNGGGGYYIDNTSFGTALSPITFTDVNINDYDSYDTGIYLRSRGAITFTNVSSNGNGGDGVDIQTLGAVIFTNVDAHNNYGRGAVIITPGTFTLNKPVLGSNAFSGNGQTGLDVTAGGKVTLTDVHAGNNGWRDEFGVPVTDAYGIVIYSTNMLGTAPIILTTIDTSGNTMDGTRIITAGAITINTMLANDNTRNGMFIDQSSAPGTLFPILLNNIKANGNGMDGIYVNSKGAITVNKFEVLFNAGNGANLLNNIGTGTAGVTVLNGLGYNLAIANGGSGVNIESFGAISVTGLETTYNGVDGLDVRNNFSSITPLVTLNNIISRENSEVGMYVNSKGVVTINNSWAASNHWDGIQVFTQNNVFINNTSSIKNDWAGIFVQTTPASTLKLFNSSWFGNLRNPNPGDRNLMFTGGTLTIS